ncbi:hypothetical protein J6590_077952 [Homalodisca vitripennis]|nr:hypothetical protein J6590_077952 [Homalodisca vitripennis]
MQLTYTTSVTAKASPSCSHPVIEISLQCVITLGGSIRSRTESVERLQQQERGDRPAAVGPLVTASQGSRAIENTYSFV